MLLPPRECRLLLVDDEPANLDLLEAFLEVDGYAALLRVTDARAAADIFAAEQPDMVLLDLHMPHVNGFDVLRAIQQRTRPGEFVPVIVLTADATPTSRLRALDAGAHDFLLKPLDGVEVRLRVRNLLRARWLYREQLAAREAAENERAAREMVLSAVAHDLRNPVASIAMDAELVREMLPEDEHAGERRALARIERTAQRMHSLIEDLLQVSRLEHAGFRLERSAASPSAWLEEAQGMMRPLAGARGVRLHFSGPADLPAMDLDPRRMLQVVANLVDNALKFTPPGGSVRVSWVYDDDALRITVHDDGAGIPADQLEHVFRPFWQGTGSTRGIGLGLVIVRAIVDAHGGRIGIDSLPGAGTAVHIELPRTPTRATDGAATAAGAA